MRRFRTGPRRHKKKNKSPSYAPPVVVKVEAVIAEETFIEQTFPSNNTNEVVRQTNHDLTCGMRALQNLYGRHIVDRHEMDETAALLEKNSFGETMYDKKLGLYSIEVLSAILKNKSKSIQRIALGKIPAKYFLAAISSNDSFSGYIVAMGSQDVNHYIAIKKNKDNTYKLIDSLPDVPIKYANNTHLFQKRADQKIYVTPTARVPVLAVLAVGATPFVKYHIMHFTWTMSPPTPTLYLNAIEKIKNIKKKDFPEGYEWCQKFKMGTANIPPEKYEDFINNFIYKNDQVDSTSILVEMDTMKTVINANNIQDIIKDLTEMGWIQADKPFHFQQNKQVIMGTNNQLMQFDSQGTLEEYKINPQKTLRLFNQPITDTKVGGFYTFNCVIQGTCIGQQHNSYSVRDNQGQVHVIYKTAISNIDN